MRRRIAAVLGGMTLALAVVIAVPAPAQALPSCPADTICLWDGQNYTGDKEEVTPNTCAALWLAFWDNKAESAYNNSRHDWYLFDHWTCGGDAYLVLSGQAVPNLGFMNNRVSGVGL